MRSSEGISRIVRAALISHVWLVAAASPLLDRFLTVERMLALLTPRRPFGPYTGIDPDLISAIVHRRLERPIHMRRRACLRLSLVLYHFLRLSGAEAVFHVAVFPPSLDRTHLHAHSWVTVGSVCLSEPATQQAVEILTYGAAVHAGPSGAREQSLEPTTLDGRDLSVCRDWTETGRHV